MSQPVKLSDALVLDARLAAESAERSIAGQIEFWAKLGKSIDVLLGGREALGLSRAAAIPLADLVELVDTPKGRQLFRAYLESEPYPHYEPHPEREGWLVRTTEDGSRTVGRFVNRVFVEDPEEQASIHPVPQEQARGEASRR